MTYGATKCQSCARIEDCFCIGYVDSYTGKLFYAVGNSVARYTYAWITN